METMKHLLYQYTPEVEFHQNSSCERILTSTYKIVEIAVTGSHRLAKSAHEFHDNSIIKYTKRMLFGPESESNE